MTDRELLDVLHRLSAAIRRRVDELAAEKRWQEVMTMQATIGVIQDEVVKMLGEIAGNRGTQRVPANAYGTKRREA